MKSVLFSFSFIVVSGIALSSVAAPLGSSRPEAQQNYEQLLKDRSCRGCDLAGVVMTRLDLRGVDLEGANLAGAKLYLADLSGANLKDADLQGASLGGADLAGADLRGANLTGAVMEGAFLETAVMDGAVTTQNGSESGGIVAGAEKVHVPDESRSKQIPYSGDVVGSEKAAGVEAPAEISMMRRQELRREPDVMTSSKKPAKMAEMEVAEVAVEVEEARKQAVSVTAVPEKEAQAGEETTAAVRTDGDKGEENPAQKERVMPQAATIEEVAEESSKAAKENAVTAGSVQRDAGQEVVGSPSEEKVDSQQEIAKEAGKEMQEVLLPAPAPDAPVYAVETPQDAAARQLKIVERLLDEERCVECDLRGVDLSGENLEEADLERADFSNGKLSKADFSEANLKGAIFQGADLRNADFRGADLYKADFRGADLTGARFEEALVDSADFSGAVGLVLPEEQTAE